MIGTRFFLELSGGQVQVRFDADPFTAGTVAKIKGAVQWSDCWTVPLSRVREVTTKEQYGAEIVLGPKLQAFMRKGGREEVDLSGYSFVFQPYSHQISGISYLLTRRKFGLFDEMGLGKTLQVLAAFDILRSRGKASRLLVVCPKTARKHWAKEIKKHTPHLSFSFFPKIEAEVILINYDILARMEPIWGAVLVADEAHKIKNPQAQRTKAFLRHAEAASRVWLVTGTPMSNKPESLYVPLRILDPIMAGDEAFFLGRYTIQEKKHYASGYKRLDELREIVSSVSIRRLKKDCLDLPPIVRKAQYIELEGDQLEAYRHMNAFFHAEVERTSQEKILVRAPQFLARMTRLRQIAAHHQLLTGEVSGPVSKVLALDELLEDILGNGGQAVVSTCYREMNKYLARRYNAASLHGGTTERQRAKRIEDFQAGIIPLLVIHPEVGGISVDLTNAAILINYDKGFSYSEWLQAAGRIHRIGQNKTCVVMDLIAEGTMDEYINEVLDWKAFLEGKVMNEREITEKVLDRDRLLEFLRR